MMQFVVISSTIVVVAMVRSFVLLFIILGTSVAMGQVQQPDRYEIELGMFEDEYNVLSGEENGVLVYRSMDVFDRSNQLWRFIKLDTTLREVWKKEFYIDRGAVYRGYDYNLNTYSLLYQTDEYNARDMFLIQLDDYTGDTTYHTIKNLVALQLEAFEMTKNAAVIGGYYNNEPVIIHYDLRTRKSKILPGIFGHKTELVQLRVDDDYIKVLLNERTFDRSNTLTIKTYDNQGEYLESYTFKPKEDTGLIFGRVTNLPEEGSLICGTYGGKKSNYSRGIFFAQHNAEIKQDIHYFNYADLENFFSYMKAKRQKRVSERIERKKVKGKKIKFNYRLQVHDIMKQGDTYIMLGEAFYPKYNSSSSYAGYSAYSGGYSGRNYIPSTFAGYRYTHAVLIGFDEKGKVLWDNSFEIEDVLTFQLEQFVHADVMDDKIVLLYLYENVIRTKIISGSEVLEGKLYNNLKMLFQDDVIKDKESYANIGGLDEWYDHNYIAYGVQKIKNLRDTGVKLNRRVFYINKVRYDKSYDIPQTSTPNPEKSTPGH